MRACTFKYILLIIVICTEMFSPQSSEIYSDKYQTGLPLVKNYLPRDYKAHNQNWAIVKDNRGVMYFGNSSGLLEFDGYDWNLIEVPNGIVRSLAVDKKGNHFYWLCRSSRLFNTKSKKRHLKISITIKVFSYVQLSVMSGTLFQLMISFFLLLKNISSDLHLIRTIIQIQK